MALAPVSGAARGQRTRAGRARRLHRAAALCSSTNWRRPRACCARKLEEALGELVALGLATSDSFGGLRALLVPSDQRKPPAGVKRRGRVLAFDIESGGRWALIRRTDAGPGERRRASAAVEHVARTLLRRYGVVFWRLLTREAGWLPPWRDLLARLPPARGARRNPRRPLRRRLLRRAISRCRRRSACLREMRRRPPSGEWVSLSGADPLNLIGILTPGPRLAALTGNRVVYRDGLPVAALAGGKAAC